MRLLKNKIVLCILLTQTLFLIPLILSIILIFISLFSVKTTHLTLARTSSSIATSTLTVTEATRTLATPFLSVVRLLSLSNYTLRVLHAANNTVRYGLDVIEDGEKVSKILMASNQGIQNDSPKRVITSFVQHYNKLHTSLFILTTLYKNNTIQNYYSIIDQATPFVQNLPHLLGAEKEKTFVVLLLNNKELRPGGGFIGSYVVVKTKNYTVQSTDIEDVYQTDGQLKVHIEPHPAVKKYLQNPDGFLRDSNFSPDFKDNAKNAISYLNQSIGMNNIDGVFGITTDAISQFIALIEPVELPASNIKITKDNFYFLTQTEVEKNFFPGSQRKKLFLNELSRVIIQKIQSISPQVIFQKMSRLIKEKQFVAYMSDPVLQSYLEKYNAAGRQTYKSGDNYLMPVEANVGANKGNVFVNRSNSLSLTIKKDSSIDHTFTTVFEHTSNSSTLPNGIYKNYYQIYIPQNSAVSEVKVDGNLLTNNQYEIRKENEFLIPTIYLEIGPHSKRTVSITYTSFPPNELSSENTRHSHSFRLNLQKQIGQEATLYDVHISLPKESALLSQDFNARIVNGVIQKQIVLSSDTMLSLSYRLRE